MKTVNVDGVNIVVADGLYYEIFALGYQQCIEDINELAKKRTKEGSETE